MTTVRVDQPRTIREHLTFLYGNSTGKAIQRRLQRILEHYATQLKEARDLPLTQRDALLITYGDQVQEPGRPPLRSLADFCDQNLRGLVSGVHVLPFYPSSSDDGFSVIDYRQVDPALGAWEDVSRLGNSFRLMFDAVINHTSVQNAWFQGFLQGDPRYEDYFITVDDDPDLSMVVRPRALPLLTRFDTARGPKQVWTTFSDDQVDLNYHNPEVLLEIIDTLLFYVAHGGQLIRLDAIAYLWKEAGTACIHLPQTHRIIQLLRSTLDLVAPQVLLITETNVSHAENVSYFGDGIYEAQLVYNFALPPLVLHAFQTGSAETLSRWASGLNLPSERTTYFNFLASHDGIGINPARDILTDEEIDDLVQRTLAHGGLVSDKQNPDGSHSPYELNINYFDALSDPGAQEPLSTQVERFLCAQAIMLAIVGVPGIYFHSLFGSRGWLEGARSSGRKRTINRQKLELASLQRELADHSSRRSQVFQRYAQLLRGRVGSPAFDPYGQQKIFNVNSHIFAVLRLSPDGQDMAFCLHNVSRLAQTVPVELLGAAAKITDRWQDIITGQLVDINRGSMLSLKPYQIVWLSPDRN